MYRFITLLALLYSSSLAFSQQLKFTEHTSWKAIQQQASKESKLIIAFTQTGRSGVHSYYDSLLNVPHVTSYVQSNFISVKLSLKKEENTTPLTRKMYSAVTSKISIRNLQNASVSFLFDSNGNLLHIFHNQKRIPSELLSDLIHYSQPENQYFTQLQLYKKDNKNLHVAKNLYRINENGGYRDPHIKKEIGNFIVTNTPIDSLFTPQYANLIYAQLQHPQNKAFDVIVKHKEYYHLADTTVVIDNLLAQSIIREYIQEIQSKNLIPEENKIDNLFKGAYKTIDYSLVKNTTLIASWFSQGKNATAIKRIDSLLNSGILIQPLTINDWAFHIVKASNKPSDLEQALKWVTSLSHQYPDNYIFLETQAHLLHKTGRTNEAITVLEKAIMLPQMTTYLREHFRKVIEEMQSGQPIW